MRIRTVPLYFALVPVVVAAFGASRTRADDPVSFVRDVAPVLSDNCFACHNAKKASGRYDMTTFERLTAGGASGPGVPPGKAADSEFHQLVVSTDDRRMPPKGKGDALPPAQAAVIARWIDQGAKPDPDLDPKADLTRELRRRWQPPAPPRTYPSPVPVRAVAFTPDGRQLVTGGYHELLVLDAVTLRLSKRVRTRAERTHALVFLPDGTLAAAGGRPGLEGDVRVYDLTATGPGVDGVPVLDGVGDPKVLVKALLDTDDEVLALAVSDEGRRVAAGGTDRIVRVWDVSRGPAGASLEQSVENHADWVQAVAFGPDGRTLFTASRDKTAKVWDLAARGPVVTFPGHRESVTGVVPSADGAVTAGADRFLRRWAASGDGKEVRALPGHAGEVLKLIAGPGGKFLVSGSADRTVRVWNPVGGPAGPVLTGPTDHILAVAVDRDGKSVAAGTYAGEVFVWPLTDPRRARSTTVVTATAAAAALAGEEGRRPAAATVP